MGLHLGPGRMSVYTKASDDFPRKYVKALCDIARESAKAKTEALSPFPPLAFKPTAKFQVARPRQFPPLVGPSLPALRRASDRRL